MFTTTLHFPPRPNLPDQPCDAGGESQLRAGAAPSELPSSLHQSSIDRLFNRQTTQAQLATPKLPQPLFHLVRIAAKPAIHCCSVTAVQKTLGSQTSDLLCLLYW